MVVYSLAAELESKSSEIMWCLTTLTLICQHHIVYVTTTTEALHRHCTHIAR